MSSPAFKLKSAARAAINSSFEHLESRQLLSGSVATAAAENALAYDTQGNLHVAYFDAAEHNLKYMRQTSAGEWGSAATIDASSPDVGHDVVMAIAPNGKLGVAYFDAANKDLKYAQFDGSNWQVWTVDSKKSVGANPSLAFDINSNPIISYYREDTGDLKLAQFNGKKFKVSTFMKKGDAGLFSSVAVNSQGVAVIAYETADGKINVAERTKKKFTKPKAIDTVSSGGTGLSVAFDAEGKPAFSYYDSSTGEIKVARKSDAGFSSTTIATVAPDSTPGATLLFDPASGAPMVVYYDASKDGLFLAKAEEAQGGDFEVLQLKANTGGSTKAVIQPANGSVTYTFTDTSEGGSGLVLDNTETTPALPTNIAATATSASAVTITWQDNSDNETGFVIQRSTDGTNFTTVTTTAPNVQSYGDTGLSEGTVYYYRVAAVGGSGEQSIGAAQSVVAVTTRPSAPSSVAASETSAGVVTVSWTNTSVGQTGFTIQRSTDGSSWTTRGTAGGNVSSFEDSQTSEGATYQYRIIATNVSGESAASSSASVSLVPASPSNLTATPVSVSSIKLTWADNSSHETAYVIERSTNGTTFTELATLGANATSYTNNSLSSAQAYYYRVRASNSAGSSARSNTANAVTDANAPTNVTATAASTSKIDLTWTDNTAGETGFRVQRSANNGEFATVATLGANVTNWSDTGRTEGVTYTYRVKALSAGTDSAYSATVTAQTLPAAPTGLSASVEGTAVTLTWTNPAAAATGFKVERSSNGTDYAQVGENVTGTTLTDTTAVEGLSYTYRVKATNSAGTSLASSITTAAVAPTAPTGLVASAASATEMELTWIDNSANETGYKIERQLDGATEWSNVATVDAGVTSYADSELIAGSLYHYRVQALGATASGFSDTSAVTIALAPSNLEATAISSTRIDLSWTGSSGATGYQIERALHGSSEWDIVDNVDASGTTYADVTAIEGADYDYRVLATNDGGASTPSNVTNVMAIPTAPSSLATSADSTQKIVLSWSDNSNGETGFEIQRSSDGTDWTALTTTQAGVSSYEDSSVTEGQTFSYRVRAVNTYGQSDWTDVVAGSALPAAPSDLVATVNSSTSVTVIWTDNSANETGYRIERSIDGQDFAQIGTAAPDAISYVDETASEGTTFYYRVRAVGAGGFSDYSSPASTTTLPATPNDLEATATDTSVSLTWTDSSVHETGYRVERSEDGGDTWTPLESIDGGSESYTDNTAQEGTAYYYRVTATLGSVESDYAVITVSTAPAAPTNLAATIRFRSPGPTIPTAKPASRSSDPATAATRSPRSTLSVA